MEPIGSAQYRQTMNLRYILITPARNEESFIEGTIQSVISQTVRPHRWIVVSDGSTDRTDEIVSRYAMEQQWMALLRMPERRDRTFAAKARCFNAACDLLNGIPHDIIGNLDADITFGPDYFEYLLGKFADHPGLGVAGTPFVEDGSAPYDYRVANIEHVSGACQLFRRECFEEIGGYVPIKAGGIDWVAVTTARMKGWQTRTFTDRTCFHHRKMGTAKGSIYSAKFRLGREDYYLGGHPLWAILRAVSQMRHKPYVLGGLFLLLGYMTSAAKRIERPVSPELLHFCRKEQMQRLRRMLVKSIGP
jgi:glycosyltransferase involved in cell wall biosynthesis